MTIGDLMDAQRPVYATLAPGKSYSAGFHANDAENGDTMTTTLNPFNDLRRRLLALAAEWVRRGYPDHHDEAVTFDRAVGFLVLGKTVERAKAPDLLYLAERLPEFERSIRDKMSVWDSGLKKAMETVEGLLANGGE